MATQGDKDQKDQPGRWKGAEVEDAPDDEAEHAAERAEGNRPVPTREELERDRQQHIEEQASERRARPPTALTPDEKIEDAAEEHQAREDTGKGPHGKL